MAELGDRFIRVETDVAYFVQRQRPGFNWLADVARDPDVVDYVVSDADLVDTSIWRRDNE